MFLAGNNPSVVTYQCGFIVLVIAVLVFVLLFVLRLINAVKDEDIFSVNKSNVVKSKFNLSVIVRLIILVLLVMTSQSIITTLFGFILFILFVFGIYFSIKDRLLNKIVGLVSLNGLFVYSLISFITLLIRSKGDISSFANVQDIVFKVFDLLVVVLSTTIVILEMIKLNKIKKSAPLLQEEL